MSRPFSRSGIGIAAFLLAASVLSGCSSDSTSMPTPVLSVADIEQLRDDATSFAERHMGAWPDVDAFVAAASLLAALQS